MLERFFFILCLSAFLGVANGTDSCREEFHKACGAVAKGEGRLIECIEKNMSTFSAECQERAKQRKENHAKMKACHEEIKKLCGNVEKGEGRKKKCIEENKSKISPDCQALGERLREQHQKRAGGKKTESPEATK